MEEQTEYVREPKKSKVGRKIFIGLLIFLLILGGVVFFAYRQIKTVMGAEDLGVTYSVEDYEQLVQNLNLDVEPEKLCLDCQPLTFTDSHEVKLQITSEQASAAFDIANRTLSVVTLSDSQIKFSEGKGEFSTMLTYQGRNYPVYISGNVEKSSQRMISGEIFDLKVGALALPSGVKGFVEESIINLANDRLATMGDTFSIDEIKLTDEGLDFEGLVPTKAN